MTEDEKKLMRERLKKLKHRERGINGEWLDVSNDRTEASSVVTPKTTPKKKSNKLVLDERNLESWKKIEETRARYEANARKYGYYGDMAEDVKARDALRLHELSTNALGNWDDLSKIAGATADGLHTINTFGSHIIPGYGFGYGGAQYVSGKMTGDQSYIDQGKSNIKANVLPTAMFLDPTHILSTGVSGYYAGDAMVDAYKNGWNWLNGIQFGMSVAGLTKGMVDGFDIGGKNYKFRLGKPGYLYSTPTPQLVVTSTMDGEPLETPLTTKEKYTSTDYNKAGVRSPEHIISEDPSGYNVELLKLLIRDMMNNGELQPIIDKANNGDKACQIWLERAQKALDTSPEMMPYFNTELGGNPDPEHVITAMYNPNNKYIALWNGLSASTRPRTSAMIYGDATDAGNVAIYGTRPENLTLPAGQFSKASEKLFKEKKEFVDAFETHYGINSEIMNIPPQATQDKLFKEYLKCRQTLSRFESQPELRKGIIIDNGNIVFGNGKDNTYTNIEGVNFIKNGLAWHPEQNFKVMNGSGLRFVNTGDVKYQALEPFFEKTSDGALILEGTANPMPGMRTIIINTPKDVRGNVIISPKGKPMGPPVVWSKKKGGKLIKRKTRVI